MPSPHIFTAEPSGSTVRSASPCSWIVGERPVNGTLAEGTITAADSGNGCGWTDLASVLAAIESGDTYVNVHQRRRAAAQHRARETSPVEGSAAKSSREPHDKAQPEDAPGDRQRGIQGRSTRRRERVRHSRRGGEVGRRAPATCSGLSSANSGATATPRHDRRRCGSSLPAWKASTCPAPTGFADSVPRAASHRLVAAGLTACRSRVDSLVRIAVVERGRSRCGTRNALYVYRAELEASAVQIGELDRATGRRRFPCGAITCSRLVGPAY
jgi:hypothetical protein